MAQNIPSLLQTAQQQYSQGTSAPTTAPLQTEQVEDGSSLGVLKGMMSKGGAAQKLAQQRTLENQKGLQKLLSETDTGFQGLLQTLAIGAGSKLGQMSKEKSPDDEMLRAQGIDSVLSELESVKDTDDASSYYTLANKFFSLDDFERGGAMLQIAKSKEEAAERAKKGKGGVTLADGAILVDQETGELIAENPKDNKPNSYGAWFTSLNVNSEDYTPESLKNTRKLFNEGNVNDAFDALMDGKIAPSDVKGREKAIELAQISAKDRAKQFQLSTTQYQEVKEAIKLFEEGKLKTGLGAGAINQAKRILDVLGVETVGLDKAQYFESITNKMALILRNPDSGLGLTGSTSNRDLSFLKASVPGLSKTAEGNMLILRAYEKVHNYKKAINDEQVRLIEENNGIAPMDLDAQLSKFANKMDVLGEITNDIDAYNKQEGYSITTPNAGAEKPPIKISEVIERERIEAELAAQAAGGN